MSFRMVLTTVSAALAVLATTLASAEPPAGRVVLGKVGRVTKSSVVHKSPSRSSLAYFPIKPKQMLVVSPSPKSGWYKVLLDNGNYGYAETSVVEALPYQVTANSKPRVTTVASRGSYGAGGARSEMADFATRFHTKYVWGGEDLNKGIDCSAFVKKMYGAIGLRLPRTAAEQALVGQQIQRLEDLRKGDRLYFWDAKRGKIGHTGIYIGNGNFVHSSSGHGGVATDFLGQQRWLKILVAARR